MRGHEMRPGPEFDRIRGFTETVAALPEIARDWLGPGDDAAVLDLPAGERLVVSTDLAVEDVHFRREWLRWETIGYRSVIAALSDLAAMAARPLGVLLSIALPPELNREVFEEIGRGAGEALRSHGAALLGGDVSRSPGPVVVDVVVLGATRRAVERAGAAPDDELWVTGTLGGAASAVADRQHALEPEPEAREAYQHPAARIAEARWLAERADLTAMIDLSDGLAADAEHLAAASGVRLELEMPAIPLAPPLDRYSDREAALRRAVSGGEDYELLMAAPPSALSALAGDFELTFDLWLTRVGRVVEGTGVVLLDAAGREASLPSGGYDHFAGPEP